MSRYREKVKFKYISDFKSVTFFDKWCNQNREDIKPKMQKKDTKKKLQKNNRISWV